MCCATGTKAMSDIYGDYCELEEMASAVLLGHSVVELIYCEYDNGDCTYFVVQHYSPEILTYSVGFDGVPLDIVTYKTFFCIDEAEAAFAAMCHAVLSNSVKTAA